MPTLRFLFHPLSRWLILATSAGMATLLAACTTSAVNTPVADSPATPDPTTQEPIAQTPEAPEAVVTTVNPETVVEGLEHPWGMAWLPDGALLITERPGRLRVVRDGVLDPNPVAGVPEVLAFRQGGLLDIALHPNFDDNGWIYFTYADGTPDANATHVARARWQNDSLTDWEVIFATNLPKEQGQHFGSRLVWLPDDTLLVSIGDGGNPPLELGDALIREQAQNRGSHLGSVVRLNDDGSVPADNPFLDDPEAQPELWSYGHRNIQGLAKDSETGQIWSTEHGSRGGDELNLLRAGENYGWPVVTFSEEYSGGPISSEQSRPGMVDPTTYWTPAIAPSGLAVYRGDRYPQWQGHIFAGGLVSQDVRRIEVDAQGNVVNQVPIPIGQRVRDVRQGPDGLLYVLTDAPNGRLVRLDPAD